LTSTQRKSAYGLRLAFEMSFPVGIRFKTAKKTTRTNLIH
jgi:hypothetical protein